MVVSRIIPIFPENFNDNLMLNVSQPSYPFDWIGTPLDKYAKLQHELVTGDEYINIQLAVIELKVRADQIHTLPGKFE